MRCLLLSLVALLSFSANSQPVEVDLYTNVLVANEELVKGNDVTLIQGDNQLVVEFDGRLKQKNKPVTVSVRPQIIVVSGIVPATDKLAIKLAAKTVKQLENLQKDNSPLFLVYVNGELIETSQQELPAKPGLFPYIDPLKLVKQHNNELGLIFDSGHIRSLKNELEAVQNKPGSLAHSEETEATLELKLWYNRASEEERKAFRRWMIDQE
ncbi:DUF2057 domain-containing protein [Vibrio brasiliensis]|uniref:DUF2057 family protein n=1 Tax=Vibrio brasiliensis TaxID=170652 RepID=UPI001EFE7D7A|nr:DUF2057 family protein [Vibrio brasiliensis]MCG9753318.1 DUF2057 domain-containing protein [Vibrio brasiliensis]